jgi:hypothetical protein
MGIFDSKTKKDWNHFLRTSSEEELSQERWRLTQQMRAAREKKLEIQAEVDRRLAENPPDRGQIVRV